MQNEFVVSLIIGCAVCKVVWQQICGEVADYAVSELLLLHFMMFRCVWSAKFCSL